MAPKSKTSSFRVFWRIVLVVLVVLPLLPEIVVLSVSWLADFSGCRVDASPFDATIDSQVPPDPSAVARGYVPTQGSSFNPRDTVCAIGPLPPVSSVIGHAMKTGFLFGVIFGSGGVVVWLALCYVSITRGWTGLLSRLTLAFIVSMIFSFIPYFGPMISVAHLVNSRCQPNESGVGPCFMYGGDIGAIAHRIVVLGWLVVMGAPMALGTFALYAFLLPIAGYALRKRHSRSGSV